MTSPLATVFWGIPLNVMGYCNALTPVRRLLTGKSNPCPDNVVLRKTERNSGSWRWMLKGEARPTHTKAKKYKLALIVRYTTPLGGLNIVISCWNTWTGLHTAARCQIAWGKLRVISCHVYPPVTVSSHSKYPILGLRIKMNDSITTRYWSVVVVPR